MRIISGSLKGKTINFIKNSNTRPLKDSVRENIFNILKHSNLIRVNIENSNILDLDKVIGVITSAKRSKIDIKSDYAKYNYETQNSEFYSNVEIKYDNRIITCDNLDLQIDNNYAIAYNNVEIRDNKSSMKAQKVTLNLITKDININSEEKVKILTD